MAERIKVLIVDDHEMVRMGLGAYLSTVDDLEIVGEANNGEKAIEAATSLLPHVILMDLVMDKMDGISATKEILDKFKKLGISVKIIVLTSFIDDDRVFAALEAGAFSYLLKTSSAKEVLDAIRKAAENKPIMEGEVTNMIINKIHKKPPKHELLTQRELEVLKLIGLGLSNTEISKELFIGIKTVKTHVSNVLAKLEVDDRTKAAVYANQKNIV